MELASSAMEEAAAMRDFLQPDEDIRRLSAKTFGKRGVLAREPSPTRTLLGLADAEDVSSTVIVPDFGPQWTRRISSALHSWQSWELPVPISHGLWSPGQRPDGYPSPCEPMDDPLLRRLRSQSCGRSPYMLSLLATLPGNSAVCQAGSKQLEGFLLWSQWMMGFGTAEESAKLRLFFDSLRAASSTEREAAAFPARLHAKYPCKKELFVASLDDLFTMPSGESNSRSIYLAAWSLLADDGLSLHRKMTAILSANQTAEPSAYLLYRGLTSGVLQLILLAAHNQHLPPLSESSWKVLFPLIVLASLLLSTYSDLYLANQQRYHAAPAVSSLEMFDDEWVVRMHNFLVLSFWHESQVFLQQAQGTRRQDGSHRCNDDAIISDYVDLIFAVVEGARKWYQTAPFFQRSSLGNTADSQVTMVEAVSIARRSSEKSSADDSTVASSEGRSPPYTFPGFQPSADSVDLRHAPASWLLQSRDEAADADKHSAVPSALPSAAADCVDKAVSDFTALFLRHVYAEDVLPCCF